MGKPLVKMQYNKFLQINTLDWVIFLRSISDNIATSYIDIKGSLISII